MQTSLLGSCDPQLPLCFSGTASGTKMFAQNPFSTSGIRARGRSTHPSLAPGRTSVPTHPCKRGAHTPTGQGSSLAMKTTSVWGGEKQEELLCSLLMAPKGGDQEPVDQATLNNFSGIVCLSEAAERAAGESPTWFRIWDQD